MIHSKLVFLLIVLLGVAVAPAQVAYDDIVNARDKPENWVNYHGDFSGQRHSRLDEITPANVKSLRLKWVFQEKMADKFETTPLVVDGVMYITVPPGDVYALDAETGARLWRYSPAASAEANCMLRARQQRPRDLGRPSVHGDTRRFYHRA